MNGTSFWLQSAFLVTAITATLVYLARELPWQNAGAAVVLVLILSFGAQCLAMAVGLRWSPDSIEAACTRALGFTIVLLNARVVARLLLRRWRPRANYGFWVIGITTFLTAIIWGGVAGIAAPGGLAWRPCALGFFGALVILPLVAPLLLDKKAVSGADW